MSRTLSLLALLLVLIALLALTGSGGRGGNAGASEEFLSARGDLDHALDSVAVTVAQLESRYGVSSGEPSNSPDLQSRIGAATERRKTIVAKLDSLEGSGGDSWRGAMVGLRANVADLEYRLDVLRFEAVVSAPAFDSLFATWLSSATKELDITGRGLADSAAVPFADERVELRARADELDERFRAVSGSTSDGMAGRQELGEGLSDLRRRLRALMRSAHHRHRRGRG